MKKNILIMSLTLLGFQGLAQPSPLNGDFEDSIVVNIQGTTSTMPEAWNWSGFGAGLTNDASSGTTAAYIWNWYYYAKGYIRNGNPSQPSSEGAAINFRPSALTGSFKYIIGEVISVNDSAVGTIYLTKFNTISNHRDTLARSVKKFGPEANYQTFEIPINYQSSDTPDSVFIKFESSQTGFCSNLSDGNCLFLYLDNLQLTNPLNSIESQEVFLNTTVSPNPASEKLEIHNPLQKALKMKIVSSEGKLMHTSIIESESTYHFDCTSFKNGIYLIHFEENGTVLKWVKN